MNIDLKYYLSVFLRRLPYFIPVVVLIGGLGLTVALLLPTKYRTSALLLVESEQIPSELASSTVSTNPAEQLQIIQQRLKTRANLLEMANRFGLYTNRPGLDPATIVDDMRDRVQILSSPERSAALTVTVAFEAETADQALQVTNSLVTQILQQDVEMRTGQATQTLEFFKQEVARLGVDLDRQESELLDFRLANQNSLPDSLEYRRTRQMLQQERLLQLQREETGLIERQNRLVALYERTGRIDTTTAQLTPEQRQLQTLQSELDNARAIYSAQNPRVVLLEGRVAALSKVVAEQTAGTGGGEGEPTLFEMQQSEIDGQLKFLREQKTLVEQELQALTASIEATPGNAARLSELERDNDITQGQYNAAVDRLAQAQTGERIEMLARGQRISLVEQAALPQEPFSPPRKLIALGSIAAGLALGMAFVLLLEATNRSIRRPVELVSGLGITPLVTLPFVRTHREQQIRRGVLAGSVLVLVLGATVGLYALDRYYLPIDLLVDRVIDRIGLSVIDDSFRRMA